MRRLGTVLLAALIPVSAFAGAATASDQPTQDDCRQQWADLDQLHGENGNPGGPVAGLRHRWEQLDDEAERYAAEATADDCGATYDDLRAEWGDLESFQYDLYAFYPRQDLRIAEADRRHYLGLGNHLSPQLKRAFHVVRRHTPGAVRDLAPALDDAQAVDLGDHAAVQDFLHHARDVKRDSSHVQRMRHPYRVIGDAELDEE